MAIKFADNEADADRRFRSFPMEIRRFLEQRGWTGARVARWMPLIDSPTFANPRLRTGRLMEFMEEVDEVWGAEDEEDGYWYEVDLFMITALILEGAAPLAETLKMKNESRDLLLWLEAPARESLRFVRTIVRRILAAAIAREEPRVTVSIQSVDCECKRFHIDVTTRNIQFDGKPIQLRSNAQFAVLKLLLEAKGEAVSSVRLLIAMKPKELSDHVNVYTEAPQEVKDMVSKLRKTLSNCGSTLKIKAAKKRGYSLVT